MAMAAKPLRLKDFLELDCDSCSAAGFRCYPRHLCVAVPLPVRHEMAEVHSVFGRSHSLRHPMLSIRSLSRRLMGSFSWRRRDEEAAPVPAASISCSSDSETSESGSSSTERKSESDCSSACSAESLHAGVTTATGGQEHEAMKRGSKEAGTSSGSGSESDEKEQLSPVAVMDFPFHDDEDDAVEDEGISDDGSACSRSFSDSLAQLRQRRNIQLKHKIRRFRSIREVAAVDLGERFDASESDGLSSVPVQYCCTDTDVAEAPSRLEGHRSVDVCQYPDEHNLIAVLTRAFSAVDASERLLLDFLAETRKFNTMKNCEAAVKLAQDWMQGTGAQWGLNEVLCGREDILAEIDRGQQWSSHDGEEIGVLVAGLVIDELVRELVNDLLL
ncbi:unnamed protein product [Alopecurus aequalis]